MSAVSSMSDIVALRISHCRAEQAAKDRMYHLAVMHYRDCLDAAERRQDARATEFFALQLARCYEHMQLRDKAAQFRALAEPGPDVHPLA